MQYLYSWKIAFGHVLLQRRDAIVNLALIRKFKDIKGIDLDGKNSGVVGGMAKFKCSGNLKLQYAQPFADMIRVGSLLTHDAPLGEL